MWFVFKLWIFLESVFCTGFIFPFIFSIQLFLILLLLPMVEYCNAFVCFMWLIKLLFVKHLLFSTLTQ